MTKLNPFKVSDRYLVSENKQIEPYQRAFLHAMRYVESEITQLELDKRYSKFYTKEKDLRLKELNNILKMLQYQDFKARGGDL